MVSLVHKAWLLVDGRATTLRMSSPLATADLFALGMLVALVVAARPRVPRGLRWPIALAGSALLVAAFANRMVSPPFSYCGLGYAALILATVFPDQAPRVARPFGSPAR